MTDTAPQIGEVVTAAAKAMAAIRKVGKEGRNEHDKYNFASIDDFLAMVNPVCADAGLIFPMQEDGIEDFTRKGKFGDSSWMRVRWQITVMHISGQSLPPVLRTVEVLRNGAQAYGSAQSYALKQFLRSFLLIPTGDKDDADLQPTAEGTIEPARRPEPSRQAPQNNDAVDRAIDYISAAVDIADLQASWGNLPANVKADARVIAAKDKAKRDLTLPAAAAQAANPDLGNDATKSRLDLDGDLIPY